MRIRTGIGLLLSGVCCAGLAACTAATSSGPDVTVTDPSVGKPAPPDSVQAALSRMAFTPYAALGLSDNDGLAPGESVTAFSSACMATAGYPGSNGAVEIGVNAGLANIAFSQPWGLWGYLGLADAEQYGFLLPPGSALSGLGIGVSPPNRNPASLPAAEQTAIGKCATIGQELSDAEQKGPLAGVQAISNDVYTDMQKNTDISTATKAWSACMARNGYDYRDPQTAFRTEMQHLFGGGGREITVGGTSISTEQNQAQIAMAVADANCTQSTDLAGIYFAVQASYEQQIVNANQQALSAAVRQYRADYQEELSKLPQLLKTAKAQPFPSGGIKQQGGKVVRIPQP